MADFTVIETQEQLDGIISERLNRQKKQHDAEIATLNSQIEEFKKNATSNEDLKKQLDTANATIKTYETASVKARVAREAGLPFEIGEMLQGETEEDIRKYATNISKYFKCPSAPLAYGEPAGKTDDNRVALKTMLGKIKGE